MGRHRRGSSRRSGTGIETVADLIQGVRDPKKSDEAARELERGREEIRRRIGMVDISAELTDPDE